MSAFTFTRAVKQQEKLRLALDGPAGSGKTWTALIIGCDLAAREGGRVAVIDSERSSAKKYASDFDFDHLTLPDWSPHTYMAAVRAAQEAAYAVIVVDSFSHAWEGVLELKDNATARSNSKNSYTEGWREATPVHNELVDTVLRADAHVIATLRTKTEYVIEDGRPKKIGLKPIQREGVDFEFDVVGDMNAENTMIISKTRCSALTGQVYRKPDRRLAETLWGWLNSGEPMAAPDVVADLRDRLNALSGAARKTFRDAMGGLDQLMAANVEDAVALVKELEADEPDPDPPATPQPPGSPPTNPVPPPVDGGGAQASPPDGVGVAEQATASTSEPSGSVAPADGPPVTPMAGGPDAALIGVRDLAKLADQAFPLTKADAPPRRLTWTRKRLRYTLTHVVTNGRTVHLDELNGDEVIRLAHRLRDIIQRRTDWAAGDEALHLRTGDHVVEVPWVDPDDHQREAAA